MTYYNRGYYDRLAQHLDHLLRINAKNSIPTSKDTLENLVQKINSYLTNFHAKLHNILYNNEPDTAQVWLNLATEFIKNDLANIPLKLGTLKKSKGV
ncbi:MAG: hypothetical protein RLZ12_538 [Bacillota bacterium]|jgi:hypothetical protein